MQKLKILVAKVNSDSFFSCSSLSKRIAGLPALRIPLTMHTDAKGEAPNLSMSALNLKFHEEHGFESDI